MRCFTTGMTLLAVGGQVADALGFSAEARELVGEPSGSFPWGAHLPVGSLATDSVALASLAIALLHGDASPVRVDRTRVAASFGSEKALRIHGAAPSAWAPLSGFWRTSDGWVRTHANYPHHERALRRLLGLADDGGRMPRRRPSRHAPRPNSRTTPPRSERSSDACAARRHGDSTSRGGSSRRRRSWSGGGSVMPHHDPRVSGCST